jgi:predicted TIM-barrel fold metal-dependent hydrolase
VLRILEIIKKYDIVLATGHISPAECFAVVEEARKLGIEKIILTHPLGSETVLDQSLTLEETIQLTRMGAYAEFTFVFHLPTELSYDPAITAGQIRAIGPEKCIISTDLGLFGHNASPVEGFRMFIATLAHQGMSEEEISLMAKTNPAKLLGLD